jgi:RimJ/RimL family protein N-acetyltransferase
MRAEIVVRTPRLALRRFRADDGDYLYRLDSDPRVMRYIGDGRVGTRASVSKALARASKYYALYPGLGVWPAESRASGKFIGWFCLKYIPNTVEVEVGYRLLPEAWSQGYATEGARALVDYGFAKLGLERIVGITHPDNLASQRVLQKSGLRDRGWGRYYDEDVRLFVAESKRTRATYAEIP